MLNQYEQNDDEIQSENNDEIINFDQFEDKEEEIINTSNDKLQSIQYPFEEQKQVLKQEGIIENVIEEMVQFKPEDEPDNIAKFGSMHCEEDFQSWRDENKQNNQDQQVQQIDTMTERQEQQAQIIYRPNLIVDMKEFLQKPIDQSLDITDNHQGQKWNKQVSSQIPIVFEWLTQQIFMFSKTIGFQLINSLYKFDRKHKSCLGKLKGYRGVFRLFDTGDNPKDAKFLDKVRKELCLINFQNSKQTGQIRQSVIVPKIKDGQPCEFKPLNDTDGLLKAYHSLQYKDQIMHFMNKIPIYNNEKKIYQLQFSDRVTMPSVKNCIIHDINCTDKNKFVLQFGKCAKKTYSVDISHPLSILQGFAICISQFEKKD
ncbi:unnamed protein product (macronuclear) [Paramecium tetraurelia]|uniref:Tubby C-terminal domain-containing protein n=1 Tax=Paramecium tetraurelia TaxID=5888 RepID=A0C9I5_PARTE|nr:uncharacterized protein GSPATT00006758001 [Paramecium tetraurelia]CAK67452.1 unnamed protein product [Paramecium tetraurelia]|eukprot:XP_001434849.1 hypothetical protein (macronuclear) [Paramecium tetraurelia strain d4-2]